jgi:hypothetical protein
MAKKSSLRSKSIIVFFITVFLIIGALFASLGKLRDEVLRNEAQAVADQVVSFRSWVAGSGMVWVNKLTPQFQDYLAVHDMGDSTRFYGKNPALATRELSTIANKNSTRASFTVTSDRIRQQANTPDAFEKTAIAQFTADKNIPFVATYQEGKYRYARPLFVKEGCLKCHGDPKDAPAAVIQKYGDKNAFGYKVGDIRGIISVTLPTITFMEALPTLANPISIGSIILAFLINFFFNTRFILSRLQKLTEDTTAIVSGKLDTPLIYTPPKESNDEVDHVYHSVDLLKRSMELIVRKIKRKD